MRINKGFSNGLAFTIGVPSDEDFEIIKTFMPATDIGKEDIFAYKVILCDNMIDRDNEKFSHEALEQVTDLFKGVVGIEDHYQSVENNHSRIYKTELITDNSRYNQLGEVYEYVLAFAYMLNNEKNKNLIDEIKGGIRKEVSIGFSSHNKVCSICGCPLWGCEHVPGLKYDIDGNEKGMYAEISSVDDAYEWSFVSVPAQPRAGVVKYFNKEDRHMDVKQLAVKIIPKLDEELANQFKQALIDLDTPESETVKSLNLKIAELERDIETKAAQIKEYEDAEKERSLDEAYAEIFDELKPKNDKLKEMATNVIKEVVKINDSGEVDGIDEAKEILKAEEYAPLFEDKGCGDPEPNEKSEEGAKEEAEDTKEETDEKKSFLSKRAMRKSIDFTRVSQFKGTDTKYSSKSVGIKTE